jgi:hypothetical protein
MKQTATEEPTPEHLLQLLDAELARQREENTGPGRNRTMFLVGGVLFIVIAAGAALFVLMQMLSDLERAPRQASTEPQVRETSGKF